MKKEKKISIPILIWSILCFFYINVSWSQICITEDDEKWREKRARIIAQLGNDVENNNERLKLVRVNIHYHLRSDGSGNFTETDDGHGNSLTGYDFARDVITFCNNAHSYNPKMNIPPGNSTPIESKDYFYVLDAVYFHKDDNHFNFSYSSAIYNTYGADKENVINIFFTNQGNAPAGHALSLDHASKIKYTNIHGVYKRYSDYLNNLANDHYTSVIHATGKTVNHEIGHTLGLSHTVRQNWAPPCKTQTCDNTVNASCDDGCTDTPSASEIVDNLGGGHPACGWDGKVTISNPCPNGQIGQTQWCSNNLMDYGQSQSLTPCQLGVIHHGLDGGMFTYTVCYASATTNINISAFSYPKMSYYGRNVTVKSNSGSTTLSGETEANIYFTKSVEFFPTTIEGNINHPDYDNKMEVIFRDCTP